MFVQHFVEVTESYEGKEEANSHGKMITSLACHAKGYIYIYIIALEFRL